MGGTSQQQAQTTQNTSQTTNPYAPAQPLIGGILGGATNLLPSLTQLTPEQQQAFAGLTAQAQAGNPYAPAIGNYANNLLSGGNATAQNPLFTGALSTLQGQLSPYASGQNIGAANPYVNNAINALNTQIGGGINAQFAGAGRDLSDSNAQAVARGESQADAPLLLGQYNQDVQNQLGAANTLYGAANTTGGLLTGTNQTALANQGQGVGAATSALQAQAAPYNQLLQIAQQQQQIPLQNLGALASLGVPIASTFGTTTGTQTGTTNAQNTLSPAQQAWGWMNAFGNLFKGGSSGSTPGGGNVGASSTGY